MSKDNNPTLKRLAVIGAVTLIFVYLSHAWAQMRGMAKQQEPLHDLLHENLPDWSCHKYIRDFFLLVPLIIMAWYGRKDNLLTKFLSYYIVIILIRCITVSVTSIPPCQMEHNDEETNVSGIALLKGTGHDLMFSGHTAFMVLSSLIITQYKLLPISNAAVYALTTGYLLLILACRAHYTVDVIISALISYFVYNAGIHI